MAVSAAARAPQPLNRANIKTRANGRGSSKPRPSCIQAAVCLKASVYTHQPPRFYDAMTRSPDYLSCVQTIAQELLLQPPSGLALRVAVDGRSGVGKTTFSVALVQALINQGRSAHGVHLDDFHQPRAKRYARGRYSAEGYYRDARDLEALVSMCLAPLGPDGSGRFATASFDLDKDQPLEPEWRSANPGQIVVVEGTFLLRPELNPHWDVRIYLHAPQEFARHRGMGRDRALLGEESEALYRQRYEGAFDLYEAESAPMEKADWRVDMTRFDTPVLMQT